jgi:apolipoprotein N-acyltransferase
MGTIAAIKRDRGRRSQPVRRARLQNASAALPKSHTARRVAARGAKRLDSGLLIRREALPSRTPETPMTLQIAIPSAAATAQSLAHRVILAEGWTRRAIAVVAGAAGALALAPVDFAPAMIVPLGAAVWLIDGSATADDARFSLPSLKSAAGAGWWLGFGYFFAGLWWLGAAMLVEADQFAWALPLASFGMPAALALFTAFGFALARLLWSHRPARVFALAAGLAASEWLRGHILTGFPWNDFGMALAAVPPLAQSASLVGLYGLDALAIAIFAAPATLLDESRGRRAYVNAATLFAALALTAMLAFGGLRLASGATGFADGVRLRIMQPNLQQDAKFKPENSGEILRRYLAISDRATSPGHSGVADATHLIWPESAFPFVLSREPQALAAIARGLQGKILITGAARVAEDAAKGTAGRRAKIFNAVEVVQNEKILAFYDKMHLVPFGEFLPLEGLLRPLGVHHLVPGVWDRGAAPRRLAVPGLPPTAPLVCYEAIFPGEVAAPGDGGANAQLLLNVTNDAWFGATSGPYQHFAQARLRAIEEGLPLVRAANTGVSAIVDPYGRILEKLPLGVEGVLDGRLPKPAPPTFFSTHPSAGFGALLASTILLAVAGRRRTARSG